MDVSITASKYGSVETLLTTTDQDCRDARREIVFAPLAQVYCSSPNRRLAAIYNATKHYNLFG
jgi:hypothetical protein